MKKIASILNLNVSYEKSNILSDDTSVSRDEWEAYLVYLEYLDNFG